MTKPQQHVDLVGLIERYAHIKLRSKRTRTDSGEYMGPCPWCPGSDDSFLVWPNSERPHWNHVRGCRRNGDALYFLQEYAGMSFLQACEELNVDPDAAREERIMGRTNHAHNPPSQEWQERAREFLHECQRYLWASKADAQRATEWLFARGIKHDTMREAGLGYCPVQYEDELEHWGIASADLDYSTVRIPQGVVIPWFYGNDLWKLSVRRLAPEKDHAKYVQVLGSSEGLYLSDDIRPGRVAMLVEGELDALSVRQEASGLIACVATGSTTRGYTHRWLTLLNECPIILQSFDSDEEGERAAQRWLNTFPQTAMRWQPIAHDTNDILQKFGGQGVARWVEAGLHHFQQLEIEQTVQQPQFDLDALSDRCSVCRADVEKYDDTGVAYCTQHYPLQAAVPTDEVEDPVYEDEEKFSYENGKDEQPVQLMNNSSEIVEVNECVQAAQASLPRWSLWGRRINDRGLDMDCSLCRMLAIGWSGDGMRPYCERHWIDYQQQKVAQWRTTIRYVVQT